MSQVKGHGMTRAPQPCQKRTVLLLEWPLPGRGATPARVQRGKEELSGNRDQHVMGLTNDAANVKAFLHH